MEKKRRGYIKRKDDFYLDNEREFGKFHKLVLPLHYSRT
mgnify:CR=1 FL=1